MARPARRSSIAPADYGLHAACDLDGAQIQALRRSDERIVGESYSCESTTMGESTIEYSKDFRMYMTTRLRNPHFPPETTAKIAMVNFSITKGGLVDQLLAIIVARERPELEEERAQILNSILIFENIAFRRVENIKNFVLNLLQTFLISALAKSAIFTGIFGFNLNFFTN